MENVMLINVIMIKQHRVGHGVHDIGGIYFMSAVIGGLSAQDAFEQMLLKVWEKILGG